MREKIQKEIEKRIDLMQPGYVFFCPDIIMFVKNDLTAHNVYNSKC